MPARDAELLERLVRIPSVTGSEAEAVRFMQDQARADGFRVREDEAGNFIADTGGGDHTLLFLGHIDTVAGHIPVRIEDGVLWGRGSVDAKGSLAAAYCAARRFVDGDVRIIIVGAVEEEGASRGARGLELDGRPDWIINGEPSGSDGITLGYKGIVRGRFAAATPAMHGAHPGPNAADAVVTWWARVQDQVGTGHGFEDVHVRLDHLETHEDGTEMTAWGDFQVRLPPSLGPDGAVAALRAAAGGLPVTIDVHEALPPALAARRNPLVAAFTTAIRAAGGHPRLRRKTGTSDFNILRQRYPDVPIVAYGPGDASLDHTPDERIALAEFARATDVLGAVMAQLAKGEEGGKGDVALTAGAHTGRRHR